MTDGRPINLHDFIVRAVQSSGIFPLPDGDVQEVPPEERLERAAKLKDDGTKAFMEGNYADAEKLYRQAAEQLMIGSSPPLPDEHADMYVKCASNAAMCFTKEEEWDKVIACCNQALDVAPDHAKNNIKILYRRGVANLRMGDLEAADADLTAAYQIDSNNRDVCKALKELKTKLTKEKKKEQKTFGGIFGKVSMYEEKTVNLFRVPSAKGDELTNFPDTVLAVVAEYLTKTERALTAVAMTAPASSWKQCDWKTAKPCMASKVMVTAKPLTEIKWRGPACYRQYTARKESYKLDFLDFGDTDKDLTAKLTDEDIGGVLVCIDAVKTLKKLKLNGCRSIVGHGLEPLRGSLVLEQIDLSLAAKSPVLFPPPAISVDTVLPILDSIIDVEGCCLKHIQLPKAWRTVQSPLLRRFLAKYNRVLNERQLPCDYKVRYDDDVCGTICHDTEEEPWVPRTGEFWGVQRHSCYQCTKAFCEEHIDWESPDICEVCEKLHCHDCNPTYTCDSCGETTCRDCTGIEHCNTCDSFVCGSCCPIYWCDGCELKCEACSPFLFCEGKDCRKANCAECAADEDGGDWGVKSCSTCNTTFCVGHLALNLATCGADYCEGCTERVLSMLLKKNKSILHYLRVWEKSYGHDDLFETDLESKDISMLWSEQERMKDRWEHLYDLEHGKANKLVNITNMFIVGKTE